MLVCSLLSNLSVQLYSVIIIMQRQIHVQLTELSNLPATVEDIAKANDINKQYAPGTDYNSATANDMCSLLSDVPVLVHRV